MGISLATENGETPKSSEFCWQFNLAFDLEKEEYNHDAIELLTSSGIDFEKMKKKGISLMNFAEVATGSGLFLNENVKWISFHGSFDFSYLMKVLTNSELPDSHRAFTTMMEYFFPNVYDLKYLVREFEHYKNEGLNKLAKAIKVDRIGPMHQAGSDSLITLCCYFKLREEVFRGQPAILEKGHNVVFGIGKGHNNHSSYLSAYTDCYPKEMGVPAWNTAGFHNPPFPLPTDFRMMMWI